MYVQCIMYKASQHLAHILLQLTDIPTNSHSNRYICTMQNGWAADKDGTIDLFSFPALVKF